MHEGRTGGLGQIIAKIAGKYPEISQSEADELGQTIEEIAVEGPGLIQKEADELGQAIDEKVGEPFEMRPREIYRLKREIIKAVGGIRENQAIDEIKEEIIKAVGFKPRMNQSKIVDRVRRMKSVSKSTVRKYLIELVNEKEIREEEDGGTRVYVLAHYENDEDLTKSLYQHLDNIVKVVKKIKADVPKMHFDVKRNLEFEFSDTAARYRERVRKLETEQRRFEESEELFIAEDREEARSLIKKSDIPAEIKRLLLDVVKEITDRRRKLDSYRRECRERSWQVRGAESKKIKQEIGRIDERSNELYIDLQSIMNAIRHEKKSIDVTIRRMEEKYVERKPSVVDEIERLLNDQPSSHYAYKLEEIFSIIREKRFRYLCDKNERQLNLKEANRDDKDWILETVDGLEKQINRLDVDLNEIKEWLMSERPLKDLVKRMVSVHVI